MSRLKNNVLQTSAAEGGEEKQEAGGKLEDKEIEREVVKLQKKISQTEFVRKIRDYTAKSSRRSRENNIHLSVDHALPLADMHTDTQDPWSQIWETSYYSWLHTNLCGRLNPSKLYGLWPKQELSPHSAHREEQADWTRMQQVDSSDVIGQKVTW